MQKYEIKIQTRPRFSAKRLVSGYAAPVALIAIGIVTESAAMQWAGFFFGTMISLWVTVFLQPANDHLTIAQARKRLDEIEAGEVPE